MTTRTITLPADQWAVILEAVEDHTDEGPYGAGWKSSCLSAASAALSTALAQPEPEGVTDEELVRHCDRAVTSAIAIRVAVSALTNEDRDAATVAGIRAVLARYGRPTIKPVPVAERLPGPEDCFSDQHGQRSYKCWAQQYHTDNDGQPLRTVLEAWDLVDYRLLARCRRWYYAWLPHHDLPLPQP
jgi:hypothetical protein